MWSGGEEAVEEEEDEVTVEGKTNGGRKSWTRNMNSWKRESAGDEIHI
jgi:hypothetical protein